MLLSRPIENLSLVVVLLVLQSQEKAKKNGIGYLNFYLEKFNDKLDENLDEVSLDLNKLNVRLKIRVRLSFATTHYLTKLFTK